MDLLEHLRPGQREDVAGAFEVARVAGEARAAERGLVEAVGLDLGAHRAVEDEDALLEEAFQFCAAVRLCHLGVSPEKQKAPPHWRGRSKKSRT